MIKYLYIDHSTKKVKSGEGENFPDPKKGCMWLFLNNPTEDEKNKISKKFKINPLFIKDYIKQVRSKRYSTEPLIFVMVDYFVQSGLIKKTNILMFLQRDIFITFLPTEFKQYNDFFKEIIEYMGKKPQSERNIGEILYEFLDRDVQDNYEVLRKTEEKIANLEKKIILKDKNMPKYIDEVLSLKKELFAMSRRFWSTSKIVFLLRKGLLSIDISKKTVGLLDDVYDTFQHQIEVLETQREMLGDILTLYEASLSNKLALISNDLNIVMKKLTSLTVIVLIPSLVASIYGMNFKYLPQADSTTGFLEAVIIMGLIAFVLFLWFHRKKWI